MTELDFLILDWIQAHLRCGFLDTLMPLITALGEYGALWILLTALLLIRKDTRKTGVTLAIALALDVLLCNVILKPLVARPRPFALREVELLVRRPGIFPSPRDTLRRPLPPPGRCCFPRAGGDGRRCFWRRPLPFPGCICMSIIPRMWSAVRFWACCAVFWPAIFARKCFPLCKKREN